MGGSCVVVDTCAVEGNFYKILRGDGIGEGMQTGRCDSVFNCFERRRKGVCRGGVDATARG